MREGSGGRLTGGGLDPKQFAHAVLQNCGQIRFKDQSVGQTEIGADFLRKAGGLRSPDPARTFFGPSVQSMKFGLTARTEALNLSLFPFWDVQDEFVDSQTQKP